MSIKLVILKSGEDIIADVKEIISKDDIIVGYLLHDSHLVTYSNDINDIFQEKIPEEGETLENQIKISLRPWLVLSKDTKIPIRPDWVITVVEPVDVLKSMYEEKVNG